MSVAEDAIRKKTCRFNAPMGFWGCTNFPIYHEDRFHAYRNFPNKMYLDVVDQEKQSIQYYDQRISMMGGSRCVQDSQGKCSLTYSMSVCSIFTEQRVQMNRSWKEEGFGSLDHALLMCEVMDPSTSRSVLLACGGALKAKYER